MKPHRRAGAGIALALSVAIGLGACGTLPEEAPPVTQVVLIWLKHPRSRADRAEFVRAARSLQMMPGVLRVEVGRALPPAVQPADRTFDLAVVTTFRDRMALAHYENDRRQRQALARYLGPLVQRYQVISPAVR